MYKYTESKNQHQVNVENGQNLPILTKIDNQCGFYNSFLNFTSTQEIAKPELCEYEVRRALLLQLDGVSDNVYYSRVVSKIEKKCI